MSKDSTRQLIESFACVYRDDDRYVIPANIFDDIVDLAHVAGYREAAMDSVLTTDDVREPELCDTQQNAG